MKRIGLAVFAACSLLSLAACGGGSGYYDDTYYDVTFDDSHQRWWHDHYSDRAFDRRMALREHRMWCARSFDDSCNGWYRRY